MTKGIFLAIMIVSAALAYAAFCVIEIRDADAATVDVGQAPSPTWKYGPSVAAAVGAIDLGTGDYTVGPNAIPLGGCFGLTYLPVALGADGCFNVQLGTTTSNRYFPSLMIHWRDYFNAGAGIFGQQKADHSGVFWRWLILVGGRLGFAGG